MLLPPRSPQRLPPLPSPSRSLRGMENVIPPRTRSSSRSPSSPADKDKPLPDCPKRSSSVYTAESAYSRNTDGYSNHRFEEEPPASLIIQPVAYQQTTSALLRRRLDDPPSPKSVPSLTSVSSLHLQTAPHPYQVHPESSSISAISAPSIADSRNVPSFKEFSRNLQNKRIKIAEAVTPPSLSPQLSPNFRAVSYESTRRTSSISPRSSGMVDRSLVPAPLFVSRNRDTLMEGKPENSDAYLRDEEGRPTSRFSNTSSEDSYVIYTGVRDSVCAYVRHKMQKKRKDNIKKERERVMSVASAKYAGMLSAKEYDRRLSSASRKASVQHGISAVYNRISKLSMSGPSGDSKEEKKQPRGRQKQLAIPTSGYQKYGAAVWEAPKRQKKSQRGSLPVKTLTKKNNSKARRRPSMVANSAEVVGAFKSGRDQMIHALDGKKSRVKRSDSEKRREALKQSIKLVGPADQVSDGTMSYRV
jgi:hypothetical protein